jgi:peptide methionine sulfoxide reductase msrA/msrB
MKYNKLNEKEKNIILEKGTEKSFSGEYNNNFREGVYVCRRCNSPLYLSSDKFKSNCGWPSFDDEIGGAIRKELDSDGKRTEILCMNCNAHLGHVFTGEKLTAKDTRHCVNSLSMKFIPMDFETDEENFIVLGGGCFWCLDAFYRSLAGVKEVISGYAGGWDENPSYEKVSDGETGHAEVVKIIYDPKILDFKKILELFFKMHDSTSLNRQGNDIGEQYRSIILFSTWNQYKLAADYIKKLDKEKIYSKEIVTEIKPLYNFYKAEEYHQDYFNKNPENAYCQMHIVPKLAELKEME